MNAVSLFLQGTFEFTRLTLATREKSVPLLLSVLFGLLVAGTQAFVFFRTGDWPATSIADAFRYAGIDPSDMLGTSLGGDSYFWASFRKSFEGLLSSPLWFVGLVVPIWLIAGILFGSTATVLFAYGAGWSARRYEDRLLSEIDVERIKSWSTLAEAGNPAFQDDLGVLYEHGRGVPQDYVRAHMWFSIAAAASSDPRSPSWPSTGDAIANAAARMARVGLLDMRSISEANRQRVAALMTAEQIAEAQKVAREWWEGKRALMTAEQIAEAQKVAREWRKGARR